MITPRDQVLISQCQSQLNFRKLSWLLFNVICCCCCYFLLFKGIRNHIKPIPHKPRIKKIGKPSNQNSPCFKSNQIGGFTKTVTSGA